MSQLDLANPKQVAAQRESREIGAVLNSAIPALKLALPKAMDPERMARIALTTIRRNEDLLKCDAMSLAGAVLESASLGLEIDSRGLAYLVPFKRKITLIVGYKGLMQLAYRSGKISNIYADVVYKKEVEAGNVSISLGADRSLRHDYDILTSGPLREEDKDNNPIVLSYAVAVFKNGARHFEFVTDSELKKRRNASPSGGGGFLWNKWIEEGWKKTAIRKLCKYMDLSPEVQRAVALDEQAESAEGRQSFDFAGSIDVDFTCKEADLDADTEPPATEPDTPQADEPTPEPKEIDCPVSGEMVDAAKDCASCHKKQTNECPYWAS